MAKKYIPYNPYRPNGTNKQRFVEPLDDINEINKVIQHLNNKKNKRNLAMFVTAYSFGLRITDLSNMSWNYVLNLNGTIKDVIWLRESKRARIRQLTVNDFTKKILEMYLEFFMKKYKIQNIKTVMNLYMFPSQKKINQPMNPNNASTLFKKIFIDAGCNPDRNYASHTIRKTSGSMLKQQGYEIHEISKFLGHTDISQTLSYIGITKEKVKNMHNDLGNGLKL